jgi:predicted DNA binding CopG/RHH family protein
MKKKIKRLREIAEYDFEDTSTMINPRQKIRFEDIGLKLPSQPPTQVVSIRLPTELLNQIKAISSQDDVPYQAIIKIMLAEGVSQKKLKSKKSA